MSELSFPVRLSDMTAATFAAIAGRNPFILLPLGSHEDHGPHQPMGDYGLADILAERIARRATENGTLTVAAPCLPFGVADYFGSSPGGLALAPETFKRVLVDLLDGIMRHGLANIVILNAHGGNVPVIHEVTLEIRRKSGLIIPSFYLWKIARQMMERKVGQERFGHGAEPLMSLNLALRPSCCVEEGSAPVRANILGLPVVGFGALDFNGLTVEVPVEFDSVPRGAIAAAKPLANAELGAAVANELVEAGAAFVAHMNHFCRS